MNVNNFTAKYQNEFIHSLEGIKVTSSEGKKMKFEDGIQNAVALVNSIQKNNKKIIMVGNGGSAGIASHQAVDYWKNGGVRAIAFNDASLLTCISNDIGYEEVFSTPISMFADENDLLLAISSSGSSKNIINSVKKATEKNCDIITFSGFSKDNPLRFMGKINFYVPSYSYGFVEILHLYIIHQILDTKLFCYDYKDIFNKNLPLAVK